MRIRVQSLLVFVFLCGFGQFAQSDPLPGGGGNYLGFSKGSPTAQTGGVDVSVDQKPTTGYTCTKITIRVIDNTTGMTLGTYTENNPGGSVSKSFTGLGSNREIQVPAAATFQSGATFDPKHIMTSLTTK